jgi:hypothetical protein
VANPKKTYNFKANMPRKRADNQSVNWAAIDSY